VRRLQRRERYRSANAARAFAFRQARRRVSDTVVLKAENAAGLRLMPSGARPCYSKALFTDGSAAGRKLADRRRWARS